MFCSKCGVPNDDQASFCKACGTPLLAMQPMQVQPLVLPASLVQRFVHTIVDGFAMYMFAFAVGFASALLFTETIGVVFGVIAFFGYFFIFEALFQKTVGKMCTGTKVVSVTGEKPSIAALLGRSLARYIPLESLSFLFYGSYPTKGWHDRLSGTLVVPQHLTPEQVRSIDPKKIAEQKPGGGASVVLIVVIGSFITLAIIGILASVVLASLNSARSLGWDAQVQAVLAASKAQADIYYDSHANSYMGFCDSSEVIESQSTLPGESNEEYVCNDTVESFAIATSLHKGGYYCVDNTGAALELSVPLGDKVSCGH